MTAYQLNKLDPSCIIDVYEHDLIGGRTKEFVLNGKVYELGASMFWGKNYYVMNISRELGLTPAEPQGAESFAIFDGKKLLFQQSGWAPLTYARMLWRYGLALLRYSRLAIATWRDHFSQIYRLQAQGEAFTTPEALLTAAGLYNLTQLSVPLLAASELSGPWSWGARALLNELVGAVNRVNYNQRNENMNAMAGLVSYLPAAAPDVWCIKEGNAQLPARLLQASGAAVRTARSVTSITRLDNGSYQLQCSGQQYAGAVSQPPQTCQQPAAEDVSAEYDAVIIAAPLESANISFSGLQLPHLPARKYQQTVTTFVAGVLDPAYFGLQSASMPPGDIMASNDATMPWTVLADKGPVECSAAGGGTVQRQGSSDGSAAAAEVRKAATTAPINISSLCSGPQQPRLYKMFSSEPLQQQELGRLFRSCQVLSSQPWQAYPQFSPPESFSPFVLGPGLFYNNAIENVASAMEMSAIAARNSALLIKEYLQNVVVSGASVAGAHSAAQF